MKSATIGDLVTVKGGGTPRKSIPDYFGGGIPWVTPKDMKRPVIDSSQITLTADGVKNSPAKVVPPGSVLVVVRSGVLKHTLPVALTSALVTLNQDMKALVPRDELDSSYLARLLKARQPEILGWVRATTADNFPIQKLLDLQIDLPPLPEQRRIAAILDRADALRAKRRQVLAYLDTLTQSIFHGMFGDPDNVADEVPFGAVTALAGGRNLVADDASLLSHYRVLKISAVTTGQFKPDESKPLPADYFPPPEHLVRPGDLLMSRANTTELVGAVAYVQDCPDHLALPDKVWRFRWREESEPTFYHALLSTPAVRRRISRLSSGTGGSMKNVSKAKLEAMALPRVPIAQQREFACRAKRVTVQRAAVLRTLAADNDLFGSLQSRAFRGEL